MSMFSCPTREVLAELPENIAGPGDAAASFTTIHKNFDEQELDIPATRNILNRSREKPNVLFISIDDLNDYIDCLGGEIKSHTPNIDKLAGQGALFTNGHCQAPICGPSRASIMTGLYPSTSGNYLQLEDEHIKRANQKTANSIFMPDYFEQFGYKTFAVGKVFHKGDNANAFDEYGGGFDWFGPKPKKRINYDPLELPDKEGYTSTDWGAFPEHDSLMSDYKVAEYAIEKLNTEMKDPFFLAVGFFKPHVPWYTPQKWLDMFPLDEIKTPPYKKDDLDDVPEIGKRVAEVPMMPTTEKLIEQGEWKNAIQAYLACIAFVDAQLGKVLDALENSGYSDNTIVILWSDHGYHLGEKNRFAKMSLWEQDTRSVLIVNDQKYISHQIIDAPVQLVDMYPTLVELCGLPEYALADGHSLTPLLENPQAAWEHPALTFYGQGNVAVMHGNYRLIQYENGARELYNIDEDPNEWNNIMNNRSYQDKVKQLIRFIPEEMAPLSKHSRYNVNDYFKKMSKPK